MALFRLLGNCRNLLRYLCHLWEWHFSEYERLCSVSFKIQARWCCEFLLGTQVKVWLKEAFCKLTCLRGIWEQNNLKCFLGVLSWTKEKLRTLQSLDFHPSHYHPPFAERNLPLTHQLPSSHLGLTAFMGALDGLPFNKPSVILQVTPLYFPILLCTPPQKSTFNCWMLLSCLLN